MDDRTQQRIKELVDAAPPLTPEQRDKLRGLLKGSSVLRPKRRTDKPK